VVCPLLESEEEMSGLIPTFAGLAIAVLYLAIGYLIGSLSWNCWHRGRVTRLSYLLFPVASWRGSLGGGGVCRPINWFKERRREAPTLPLQPGEISRAQNDYLVWLAVTWPVKIVLNLFLLVLLLPLSMIDSRIKKTDK